MRRHSNKYGAIKCRCWTGHQHDSGYESQYCNKLSLLKKAGEIKFYEAAPRYILTAHGKTIGHHKPDFIVTNNDDSQEVHEFKGVATDAWRLRKKLFEANYPNIPYLVKYRGDLL